MINLITTQNLEVLNEKNLNAIKGGISSSLTNLAEDTGSKKKDVDSESADSYSKD